LRVHLAWLDGHQHARQSRLQESTGRAEGKPNGLKAGRLKRDTATAHTAADKADEQVAKFHGRARESCMTAAAREWSNSKQPIQDLNDGKPWSEMDLFDLRNSLAYGRSIEEVAGFLCRAGTVAEVKRKAEELGLLRSRQGRRLSLWPQ
jgi:hypothetical protein